MEAHEALIAGALGLTALYAWQRQKDPLDKWLALVALWICVTGIVGLLMTELADPARYVRLALRLTGPPLLLLLCEEAVRTRANPGSRRTSLIFAGVIFLMAVGALIYFRGGTLVELQIPFVSELRFGVTAWMAILAVCFLASLLTLVPAALKGTLPGFAGLAALTLLASEGWAAIDARWYSGSLDLGAQISYRSLLTFVIAGVALLKAHQPTWRWMASAASKDPLDPVKTSSPAPARPGRSPDSRQDEQRSDDEGGGQEGDEGENDEERRSSTAQAASAVRSSPSRSRGSKGSKKKGKR